MPARQQAGANVPFRRQWSWKECALEIGYFPFYEITSAVPTFSECASSCFYADAPAVFVQVVSIQFGALFARTRAHRRGGCPPFERFDAAVDRIGGARGAQFLFARFNVTDLGRGSYATIAYGLVHSKVSPLSSIRLRPSNRPPTACARKPSTHHASAHLGLNSPIFSTSVMRSQNSPGSHIIDNRTVTPIAPMTALPVGRVPGGVRCQTRPNCSCTSATTDPSDAESQTIRPAMSALWNAEKLLPRGDARRRPTNSRERRPSR